MLDTYTQQFAKLKVDRNPKWGEELKNGSPYKPLLLLAILDLIEQGEIQANLVELSPELVELFTLYYSKVLRLAQKKIMLWLSIKRSVVLLRCLFTT